VQKDFQQCIAEAFALDAIRRGTARMVRGG